MSRELIERSKWGALECTFSGYVPVTLDADGKELETEEQIKAAGYIQETTMYYYTLQCECGTERRIPKQKFPGKRLMRDCGCGLAAKGNAVMVAISTASDLRDKVIEHARLEGIPISHMWTKLLRWGLERLEEGKG